MTEPLDIFAYICDLLQVLVLSVIENWIVDDDPIDIAIGICSEDSAFELFAVDFA